MSLLECCLPAEVVEATWRTETTVGSRPVTLQRVLVHDSVGRRIVELPAHVRGVVHRHEDVAVVLAVARCEPVGRLRQPVTVALVAFNVACHADDLVHERVGVDVVLLSGLVLVDRPGSLIAVHMGANVEVDVGVVQHLLNIATQVVRDMRPDDGVAAGLGRRVHRAVTHDDDPRVRSPIRLGLLEVSLEPRQLVAERAGIPQRVRPLRGLGDVRLSVNHHEVGVGIVKAVPHVQNTATLLRRHAEAVVVRREVVGPRVAERVGEATARRLMVAWHSHIRGLPGERLHRVRPAVPNRLERLLKQPVVGVAKVAAMDDPVVFVLVLREARRRVLRVGHAHVTVNGDRPRLGVAVGRLRREAERLAPAAGRVATLVVVLRGALEALQHDVVAVRDVVDAGAARGGGRQRRRRRAEAHR
mmetsp:Transcript_12813/g.30340  ORF Transcript_12813/g.30340 Transcript_12813/m.30340 type:complete len:416 (-) Transcript_12813:208-1455(-)